MSSEQLQELVNTLARTPETIAAHVAKLSDDEMRIRKAYDEFSILENVCHLRDLEVEGYAKRINLLLNEAQPLLPDFDGAQVAGERDYNRQNFQLALEAFALAREQNVRAA